MRRFGVQAGPPTWLKPGDGLTESMQEILNQQAISACQAVIHTLRTLHNGRMTSAGTDQSFVR